MDAKWIAIIVLAIVLVFLFFRGESIRKSADDLNTWNQEVRTWAETVNQDFWDLRSFVCGKYPGECTDGDKRTDPPDPPPEFP